ncbi:lysozyme inhibitor LprI family protein [uncultured Caulobacter sp.]|uniref:lysozyme inhibitor LprI family protein n=1 Tax=uncultured Caulobacter sp. TaxID=158749 RepID=UPI00263611EA|nr:lysozyme inhibitor LprI family protein [uncultured Caulobacter sp.]
MIRLFAAATLLLLAPAAHAEPKYSATYDRCLASPEGQSTIGMIRCAGAELKLQDARLNRAYQDAMKRLDLPRQKAALKKAQRAWIAYRDADCASVYDPDWGSLARIEANACMLDHTARRADALEGYRRLR